MLYDVKKFYEVAMSQKKFNQKFLDELKKISTVDELKSFIEENVQPVAKDLGYDFSTEDILNYEMKSLKELSDAQLANVSGGGNIKNLAVKGISSLLVLSGGIAPSLQPYTNTTRAVVPKATEVDNGSFDVEALKSLRPKAAEGKVVAEGITEENIINKLHEGSGSVLEARLETELSTVKDDDYDSLDKIARKYLGREEITLPRNPKLAKDWIKNALKVYMVFPYLFGNVYIIPQDEEFVPGSEVGAAADTGGSTIRHFKCLEKSDKAKTHQVKGYDRRFTIVHELGHVIDFSFFLSGNGKINMERSQEFIIRALKTELNKREEKDPYVLELMTEWEKVSQAGLQADYGSVDWDRWDECKPKVLEVEKTIVAEMSQYAAGYDRMGLVNMETFAEALTDVVINGEGATDLAKEIVKQLVCEVSKDEIHF